MLKLMGNFEGFFSRGRNQNCSQWADIYLKYRLCSVRDGVSLALGLASVLSWGVAEVPQVITNYKEKSVEGLSVAFLVTWIIGDLFNLFGCKLEPATLPTQYYMAMLYTATTVILTSQTIYYGHIYQRLKANRINFYDKGIADAKEINGSVIANEGPRSMSSPIPVSSQVPIHNASDGRELYYTSARSLSKSHTPTVGSFLSHSRDAGRFSPSCTTTQNPIKEPLLVRFASERSASPVNTKRTLCVASAMTVFFWGCNVHLSRKSSHDLVPRKSHEGIVIHVARKLLQSSGGPLFKQETDGSSGIGASFGWAMAAIYMGGRLPQICLNIRRGNVEGLNPLMFIFALFGNITYVASILVKTLDWSKLKPNLPWLVDAGGCVFLDSFIILQFVYFRYWKHRVSKSSDCHVDAV